MKQRIDIDTFMKVAGIGQIVIAPGGERVAFLVTRAREDQRGYRAVAAVYDATTGDIREMPSWNAEGIYWRNEGELLFTCAAHRNCAEFCTQVWSGCLKTGERKHLCDVPFKSVSILGMTGDGRLLLKATDHEALSARLAGLEGEAREREIAKIQDENSRFTVFDEYPYYFNGKGIVNGERTNIYRVDLDTGAYTSVFPQGFYIENAAYCPESGKIAACGFEPYRVRMYKEALLVAQADGSGWKRLIDKETFRIERIALWDGRIVITVNMEKAGSGQHTPTRMLFVDWETGEASPVTEQPMFIGNAVLSDVRLGSGCDFKASGEYLYYIQGQAEDSRLMRINTEGVVECLAGERGTVELLDVQGDTVYCAASQESGLSELYRYDGRGFTKLSSFNDWIHQEYEVAPLEEIRFTCDEGVEIHGFVVKPLHYVQGHSYPMILDIHGGPGMAYGSVFMHEIQYWAAQGYFVAFCNPRGSGQRGADFLRIFGLFGTKDYDDLMRFTDLVLEKYKDIDPLRLGVTGGSYGGYMTNWIIGHTNRFAAAASQRSISNMLTMDGVSDCAGYLCEEWTHATGYTDIEQVWRLAPLAYAKNVRTPTLFLQSDEDFRCPPTEALQMFTAVLQNGTEARMILFKQENHGLSRNGKTINRIRRLWEITNWMDRHLRPDTQTADEERGEMK